MDFYDFLQFRFFTFYSIIKIQDIKIHNENQRSHIIETDDKFHAFVWGLVNRCDTQCNEGDYHNYCIQLLPIAE